ncbi:MAG: peroxide stress protein YaaA [Caulobacteraceae bacterium]
MYAKTARGLMARFIIDQQVERAEDLKAFDQAGYGFSAELSTPDEWLFVREDHP